MCVAFGSLTQEQGNVSVLDDMHGSFSKEFLQPEVFGAVAEDDQIRSPSTRLTIVITFPRSCLMLFSTIRQTNEFPHPMVLLRHREQPDARLRTIARQVDEPERVTR
jgi:hypothetical protein